MLDRASPKRLLTTAEPFLTAAADGDRLVLTAAGQWTAVHADALEREIMGLTRKVRGFHAITIDMRGIARMDTFGAWLLERLTRGLTRRGCEPTVTGLADVYGPLIDEVRHVSADPSPPPSERHALVYALDQVGRTTAFIGSEFIAIMRMLGAVAVATVRAVIKPWTFRFTSTVHHMDRVGWHAVPIIALITFLIGCIIAQQGIFNFRRFGADIFVVDMIGILVLRELGVLIVCIMVAGRSGSAYTAELGSMKMREEVDALRTMGLDPIDVLVLPRIVALMISVPILTFIGSMAAIGGGLLVSWAYGGLDPTVFISRLKEAISLQSFLVGMVKAPFMALVIGIVACAEGFEVQGSAESLGLRTTSSVVKSIFLVIVLDGFFAMFFGAIGI
jgi:phospholipid/cholesterol/gamma-HCH transport system permease protein